MIAFFTGSLPGSFATRPLRVARAGAADEDIGKLCAESAEATTSHNKAARGNFILLFGCGEEFQSRPNLTARIDQILTSYSNPVSARIQMQKNLRLWDRKISGINNLRSCCLGKSLEAKDLQVKYSIQRT
jgi:hypothetical protein